MILDETQRDRDIELAALLGMSFKEIEGLEICAPSSIRLYDDALRDPCSKEDMLQIYKNYQWLNFKAYLRTLMHTSVERRHPELLQLLRKTKGKNCLDFGSGVGTHAIALCENGNNVTLLDVSGPLAEFARKRLVTRGLSFTFLDAEETLPSSAFDVVICSDVLEHTYDPVAELHRILESLKEGGILHILVSTMIKESSGHFRASIEHWTRKGGPLLEERCKRISTTLYRKRAGSP